MEELASRDYKASMRSRTTLRHRLSARNVASAALMLVCAAGCGNSERNPRSTGTGGANAEGGAPMSASGGLSTAGAAGEAPASGGASAGAAGAGPVSEFCTSNDQCNDGLYCNGVEVCKQLPNSDLSVCMRPQHGPCWPSDCDEGAKQCDCRKPDNDGDGYPVEGCKHPGDLADCDDTDGDRHPTLTEDCEKGGPHHDEDCYDKTYGIKDSDLDNYSDAECSNELKFQPLILPPTGALTNSGTDCDDGNRDIHPNATEVCDNLDNDCDGFPDRIVNVPLSENPNQFFKDFDRDSFGDASGAEGSSIFTLCNIPPPGYVKIAGDCDDTKPGLNPGIEEKCNGIDDNCDLLIDQPLPPAIHLIDYPFEAEIEFECKGSAGWAVKQCPSDKLDCDGKYQNACETPATSLCNCHACGQTCAFACGETSCEELSALSTGYSHTCGLIEGSAGKASNSVACWGYNGAGQLGDGSTKTSESPVKVPDLVGVSTVRTGEGHSCAIASEGVVSCWGSNEFGQLGAGTTAKSSPYPLLTKLPDEQTHEAKWLAAGLSHACAIYDSGLLACWGLGDYGQLADGVDGDKHYATRPRRARRRVAGSSVGEDIVNATQVVAGTLHTCALAGGRVECWGNNEAQQLGFPPEELALSNMARPVPGLEGIAVDELAAAALHTCARAGSAVYCWGSNTEHQLALEGDDPHGPTLVHLDVDAVAITAGAYFNCALGSTHAAYCWGSNDAGERGAVGDPPPVAPTPISLSGVVGIFGGHGRHLCATTQSHQAWCWGANDAGQLGNGETSTLPQPTPQRTLPLKGRQTCTQE